jgi:simple sugar transport system ATP-binding protein
VGLSDTIRVILRGRLVGQFDPDTVTREELGAAMTGASAAQGGQPAEEMPISDPVEPAAPWGSSAPEQNTSMEEGQ